MKTGLKGIVILLYAMSAFLLTIAGCGEEQEKRLPVLSTEAQPDQILTDTNMSIYEEGTKTAVISAGVVNIFENRDYASLEDSVTINFFNKKGEHTTTLTSLRGEIWGMYDGADSLRASGDVVITSEENKAFMQAPAIRWIAGDSLVYGEGVVRLNSENGYEEGTGFEAKDDLSEYRFRGPVVGEVRGEKSILPGTK